MKGKAVELNGKEAVVVGSLVMAAAILCALGHQVPFVLNSLLR